MISEKERRVLLLKELESFPEGWALTPLDGRKRPYRSGWQKEKPLSRWFLGNEIRSGRAKGIGLRCGPVSGGILVLDFDGFSAYEKYLELSGGDLLEKTIGWTSGRPGHFHIAFQVPEEYWDTITSKSIATGWDENGKRIEGLEFLWEGRQSVLPGSEHPTTPGYYWLEGKQPEASDVPSALTWIIQEAAKPEPKYKPSERVENNSTENPWDIRNFAHLLEGYRPDGRRGWDTCKCPAHNGQSDDSLHIEQSSGAFKCHAGCDPKEVYQAAIELAKSHGYQLPQRRGLGHSFTGLLGGFVHQIKRQFERLRKSPYGFGFKSEVNVEPTPLKTSPSIEYENGERLSAWQEAKRQGYKYILDTSVTGSGKSYEAGLLTPETLGIDKLFYLSAEHRNPSTNTLKEWPDLESRHDGLYRDDFRKLRRVDKNQQPYVVAPNCGRNNTISALRNKNIPGSDTAELICSTCPQREPCKAGAVYGFLNQRGIKLKEEKRLRVHPASLPSPTDNSSTEPFDYTDKGLLWDEATQLLKYHRSIEVRETDIDRAIADLVVKAPTEFNALLPVLINLKQYLSGEIRQPNKYGWKDNELRQSLNAPADIDIESIRKALAPNLGRLLDTEEEYGVSQADVPRHVRKLFSESDRTTSEKIERNLALNWLPDFLDVLAGNARKGSFRIQYDTLTLTLPDTRTAEIAQSAGINVFLDATMSVEDLALILDCDQSEILTVRQVAPEAKNLEIIQVATVGRLGVGYERSDFCQKRVEAIVTEIQKGTEGNVEIIDFKSQGKEGDGKHHWWVGTRGVNDLQEAEALIIVGTPCQNIADLEARFTALHGRTPTKGTEIIKYPIQVRGKPSEDLQPWFEMEASSDPEFRAFVRSQILADIHQAIGRLRANRRPNEQLKVYFVGDYPIDLPVSLIKASAITPEAATKTERFEMAVKAAVDQLSTTGRKITQTAIAAITGYSQQHVSRSRNLLILLIGANREMSKTGEPPPDPEEARWMSSEYLPLLADSPPEGLVKGVLEIVEVYGKLVFKIIWDAVPAASQIKILKTLVLTLPRGELQEILALTSNSI